MSHLWDTHTAIYYLQQQFPPGAERYFDRLVLEEQPAISVITEIELLCWKSATPEDISVLKQFIESSRIIGLEDAIKATTADIRKAHRIKLPDAIIAATALSHELKLITRNISDFKQVQGLKLLDPFIL